MIHMNGLRMFPHQYHSLQTTHTFTVEIIRFSDENNTINQSAFSYDEAVSLNRFHILHIMTIAHTGWERKKKEKCRKV